MLLVPQYSPSGTNSMLNFFTGALDVAYMGSSPMMLGTMFDLQLRVVGIANAHAGSLAIVRKPGPKNDASQAKIGTTLGSDGHVLAHHFTVNHELDAALHINLSPAEAIDALAMGMIDYAALWEPHVSVAVSRGAEIVFSDQDLDFTMYSFIVASERSLREKPAALKRLVTVHQEAISGLETGLRSLSPRLRMIFGSSLPDRRYVELLREGYSWHPDTFFDGENPRDEIAKSLSIVAETHILLGTGGSRTPKVEPLFEAVPPGEGFDEKDGLNLGYSNSIMCTSFHVADLLNLFRKHDFQVSIGHRRVEERIARLDEDLQDDLRLCHEILPRDPGLVIQKLGRLNEQIFREISRSVIGEEQRSLGGILQELETTGAVPRDTLSWADSIRLIRNVATHDDAAIRVDEAHNAFSIFLNIVEWYTENREALLNAAARCPRCRANVEADWVACPQCGLGFANTCTGCNAALEPNWKLCPSCGQALTT